MDGERHLPVDKKELRWKNDLLSSSLQLEYLAGRKAVAHGYRVVSDYSYSRIVAGTEKEFSIDLLADRTITRVQRANEYPYVAEVYVPIECKYRRPGIAWFFLPEVNALPAARVGPSTVRCVTSFCYLKGIDGQLDLSFPPCYKGVEVDLVGMGAQRVTDQELRHGLQQLEFAMIPLVQALVSGSAEAWEYAPEAAIPAFYLPILVTTAPLYVAFGNLDELDISKIASLADIGTLVGALTVDLACGPQLQQEVRRAFFETPESYQTVFGMLDAKRKNTSNVPSDAVSTLEHLQRGSDYMLRSVFSRILVCNVQALDAIFADLGMLLDEKLSNAEIL